MIEVTNHRLMCKRAVEGHRCAGVGHESVAW